MIQILSHSHFGNIYEICRFFQGLFRNDLINDLINVILRGFCHFITPNRYVSRSFSQSLSIMTNAAVPSLRFLFLETARHDSKSSLLISFMNNWFRIKILKEQLTTRSSSLSKFAILTRSSRGISATISSTIW